MLRTRHLACLLALVLALPSAAFAQGAGDDQYQDPLGDQPTAPQGADGLGGQAAQDGDLSEQPPGGPGPGDGAEDDDGTPAPAPVPAPTPGPDAPAPRDELPNTGADPRPLALFGLAFVLLGVGLRLRTIDPDAF